ncbi:MAG: c-type cytochrome [Acidobacteria bacterium]|nr:c-type cytochrome [Acidobacteriota bacterium]
MAKPSSSSVPMTAQRIARGKYLFEVVADCDGCHSERDFSRFAGPLIAGRRGKGFAFPAELGLPGNVVAPNLTPDRETGLGAWTDGDKIRAIRDGVSRDGRALFPVMGYPRFRHMSDEDVEALVAFMNTLAPVRNPLPTTSLMFPVSLLVKSDPRPAGNVAAPDRSDKLRYGQYLANLAGCQECHTRAERGRPVGQPFAGGEEFRFSESLMAVSANISPDPETGIGRWSERRFLDTFYQYKPYLAEGSPKSGPERFTVMPWLGFAQMEPEDLKAIYTYLMTQPPVNNKVETRPGYGR